MPFGIQVYDAQGNLELSVTDSITRILGSITLNQNQSGSFSDARLAEGRPFFQIISEGEVGGGQVFPSVNIEGTTIKWKYDPNAYGKATLLTATVLYGIY